MQVALIGAIATALVAVVLALQNNIPVTVNFLLWRFDGSLAMALMIALALGALLVALLTTPGTLKRQWQLSRQKRQIEELQLQIEAQKTKLRELEVQHSGHSIASPPDALPLPPQPMAGQAPPHHT